MNNTDTVLSFKDSTFSGRLDSMTVTKFFKNVTNAIKKIECLNSGIENRCRKIRGKGLHYKPLSRKTL